MKITLNEEDLIREFTAKTPQIQKELNRVGKALFTETVLSDAVPLIESLLKSISSLPTRDGKYQFYDTQSDIAKAAANWNIPKNTGDTHLLLMWKVDYEVGNDGEGSIIVSNDKLVGGKKGTYYLFDLLWNGTEPYIVAAEMSDESKMIVKKGKVYKSGKRQGQKRPDKVTFTQSEQEKFKKKHGKAAFKIWEGKLKDQMVLQGRLIGKRNYHISAVEQDRRQKAHITRAHAVASNLGIKARAVLQFLQVGGKEKTGEDYGKSASGGTRSGFLGLTKGFGNTLYGEGYQSFTGKGKLLIKEFAPPKMRYYNRFKDRFCYNQIYRRGIEGKVVEDFHDYIATCVYRGLMMAAGYTKEGNRAMIVQQMSNSARGYSDFVYSY